MKSRVSRAGTSIEGLSHPQMTKDEFRIGLEFYTAAGKWRCTDIGLRVIVAIQLDQHDPSWYVGPPYAVPEWVFDEYDLGGCALDPRQMKLSPSPVADNVAKAT